MASLTETAKLTRKVIRYGAVAFVAISILWFVGGAPISYYRVLSPPAPAAPTMDFGLLPAVIFPKENGRPKMTLELPTGVIPEFPDRMSVYYAPTKRSGFLDAQKAIDTARSLGFTFNPDIRSEINYVWTNQDPLSSRLQMDIVSGHFVMTRVWQNNPALLSLTNFASNRQVVDDVTNFLRKADLVPNDVTAGPLPAYLKAVSGKLVPTISLSEADFVQIDFFRNNLETIDKETKKVVSSYPFYRLDPDFGLIRAIESGSKDSSDKVVELYYNYTIVNYTRSGTYPIKTGDAAWQEFSSGGGFVTDKSKKSGTVAIRRVLLGYFDSPSQNYAMPIYIFLGDSFVGYLSAITDTVLKK